MEFVLCEVKDVLCMSLLLSLLGNKRHIVCSMIVKMTTSLFVCDSDSLVISLWILTVFACLSSDVASYLFKTPSSIQPEQC